MIDYSVQNIICENMKMYIHKNLLTFNKLYTYVCTYSHTYYTLLVHYLCVVDKILCNLSISE